MSARKRFIDYVNKIPGSRQVVSPFLPYHSVIKDSLKALGKEIVDDYIQDEITLSKEMDYEPMFMTDCSGLIFSWTLDKAKSDDKFDVSYIESGKGKWEKKIPKGDVGWNNDEACPVRTVEDHYILQDICTKVSEREASIRQYFRDWRKTVGENGVIVIGHPHPSWLGYQIASADIFTQWSDFPEVFKQSMDAIYEASIYVMKIAVEEDIDFMSDSSYGLEMTSPKLFNEMDLPYIQNFAKWTHKNGKLFWYHNCGQTRQLIMNGTFNKLGADVIETISEFPEGDNVLAESREALDKSITSKGNLSLTLLRDGKPEEVVAATKIIVDSVKGYSHIISTADAVLPGTPAANFIAFLKTARELTLK
jgi:hypothetical protein